jgi:hypothetical protein
VSPTAYIPLALRGTNIGRAYGNTGSCRTGTGAGAGAEAGAGTGAGAGAGVWACSGAIDSAVARTAAARVSRQELVRG